MMKISMTMMLDINALYALCKQGRAPEGGWSDMATPRFFREHFGPQKGMQRVFHIDRLRFPTFSVCMQTGKLQTALEFARLFADELNFETVCETQGEAQLCPRTNTFHDLDRVQRMLAMALSAVAVAASAAGEEGAAAQLEEAAALWERMREGMMGWSFDAYAEASCVRGMRDVLIAQGKGEEYEARSAAAFGSLTMEQPSPYRDWLEGAD